MFFSLMLASFYSIFEVLLIGILGTIIIAGFRPSQQYMQVLSNLFLRITLPCLVFSNMVNFRTTEVAYWWVFPLLGVILFLTGGLVGYGYTIIDRSVKYRGIFTSSIAFHNSILLPLAFAPVLFGPEKLQKFLNLLFLYNLLTIPVFFTFGVWLINSSAGIKIRARNFFTPINMAVLLGLLFAITGWNATIPEWFLKPLMRFGSLSSPLSMLIVGGIILSSMAKISFEDLKEPVKIALLKSIVFPACACLFVYFTRPSAYTALFIIMGSVMPVGSVMAIVCPPQKEIQKTVAGGILLTSLASILTVPVFMGIYGALYEW